MNQDEFERELATLAKLHARLVLAKQVRYGTSSEIEAIRKLKPRINEHLGVAADGMIYAVEDEFRREDLTVIRLRAELTAAVALISEKLKQDAP